MGNFIFGTNHNQALISAASAGDLEGVKKALEYGAQINYFETNNPQRFFSQGITHYNTALAESVCRNHLQVVQYLCEAGANPYLPYQESLLHDVAWDWGLRDVARYLEIIMKSPKHLNKIDDATGYTPLTLNILNHCLKMSTKLIDFGADVCKVDRHGKTPLIYAIEEPNQFTSAKIINKLLKKGAIASGVSAMKRAFELGKNGVLKLLILFANGPIIDGCFDDGYTPLTKSIITQNIAIGKCLIDKGADASKVDMNNNIPLEKALEIHCLEIANLLVSKGARLSRNIPDFLFQRLAEDGHRDTYVFLIKYGWDVNQVDAGGKTALSYSASNQNLLLSRLLIVNGAKIDLAQAEVDQFRKDNMDFVSFLQEFCKQNNNATTMADDASKKTNAYRTRRMKKKKNIKAAVDSEEKNWDWKQTGHEQEA